MASGVTGERAIRPMPPNSPHVKKDTMSKDHMKKDGLSKDGMKQGDAMSK
jgi:pentapeptide MXKDX repeat protein